MNKLLFGILAAGAAAAVGYFVAQSLKEDEEPEYDDDIYDYPDPYDSDESIDFEINDSTISEAAEAVKEAEEEAADAVEEAAEAVEEAVEEAVDEDAE